MVETIEQAVEILNKRKWRERDDWHINNRPSILGGGIDLMSDSDGSGYAIDDRDALAIANLAVRIAELESEVAVLKDEIERLAPLDVIGRLAQLEEAIAPFVKGATVETSESLVIGRVKLDLENQTETFERASVPYKTVKITVKADDWRKLAEAYK